MCIRDRSTRDFLMYKTTLIRMKELGKELYSLQEGLLTENDLDKMCIRDRT